MPFNFNVEIDWNADGDYSDTHENISSEVKAISIEYGRDNDLQKAQAGRARILVRDSNANWFYGNLSSDIVTNYGGIYPARAIRVWTASPSSSDSFAFGHASADDNSYGLFGQSGLFQAAARIQLWRERASGASATVNDGRSVLVTGVRMMLWRAPSLSCGVATIAIQGNASGEAPNNIAMRSALFSGQDLPTERLSAELRTITFAPSVRLDAEQTYWLVATAMSAAAVDYRWQYHLTGEGVQYKRGSTTNGGVLWTRQTGEALSMMTYGHLAHNLFTGLTDDVAADPAKNARQATIYANDGTDQLQRAKITMALQENKYSGGNSGLVNLALDRAGWPANRRAISSAELDLYPLVHADRQDARGFLDDIERSEFGFGYIRNDGYFAWEDRNYRTTWARCTSSQWTCTENEHRNITPISPLAGIINTVILRAQPKTKAADLDVIWSLQENAAGSNSPYLGTGSVTNYWAKYALSGQVPNIAGEVAALISGTDFTANTARDGSGTDRTVQISTAITIFAGSAKLAVTNLSNGAYLTKLQVRGKIYRDDPPLEVVAEDTSSQTAYLERHYEVDLPYYSNAATMQAVADAIITARKNPKAVYEIELINADDTIWEQILARRISDRITLSNGAYNISGDFFIEKIRHEIAEAGKFHRCWWTVTAV